MLDSDEIPNDLLLLIESCNDLVCSKCSSNGSAKESFSSVVKEKDDLKSKYEALKEELLELKAKSSELEKENSSLKGEQEKLLVLTEAFKRIQ